MKQIPILYSTLMVLAILKGIKSQTRRTSGLEEVSEPFGRFVFLGMQERNANFHDNLTGQVVSVRCPYGMAGDVMWVREKWKRNFIPTGHVFHYYAGNEDFTDPDAERWKPSIHMPKEAARIWLKVVEVRVERLHKISIEDAKAEGIYQHGDSGILSFRDYLYPGKGGNDCYLNAYNSFATLWKSINGDKSWDVNPYVWVVKFEKIEKPADNA